MKKSSKIIIISASIVATALALAVAIPFSILGIKTRNMLNSSIFLLKNNAHYSQKVEVNGVNLVTQHVSCGYATIEMLSEFYGKKVSEDELDQKNKGGVSTQSSSGFLKEANRSIEGKEFTMKSYLKHEDFLKEIHDSLSNGNPVAIEWAAKYNNEWTLHFSLVTMLDIGNEKVTVYNPYGYVEDLSLVGGLLPRTSFQAYKNMPIFLQFGFAYGAFHKNTVFYAK